jgi:hypothetical protein
MKEAVKHPVLLWSWAGRIFCLGSVSAFSRRAISLILWGIVASGFFVVECVLWFWMAGIGSATSGSQERLSAFISHRGFLRGKSCPLRFHHFPQVKTHMIVRNRISERNYSFAFVAVLVLVVMLYYGLRHQQFRRESIVKEPAVEADTKQTQAEQQPVGDAPPRASIQPEPVTTTACCTARDDS